MSGCSSKPQQPETLGETERLGEESEYSTELFEVDIYNPTKVGYSAEYLETTQRRLPEVLDCSLERYPQYGVTLSNATAEEKSVILAENTVSVCRQLKKFLPTC